MWMMLRLLAVAMVVLAGGRGGGEAEGRGRGESQTQSQSQSQPQGQQLVAVGGQFGRNVSVTQEWPEPGVFVANGAVVANEGPGTVGGKTGNSVIRLRVSTADEGASERGRRVEWQSSCSVAQPGEEAGAACDGPLGVGLDGPQTQTQGESQGQGQGGQGSAGTAGSLGLWPEGRELMLVVRCPSRLAGGGTLGLGVVLVLGSHTLSLSWTYVCLPVALGLDLTLRTRTRTRTDRTVLAVLRDGAPVHTPGVDAHEASSEAWVGPSAWSALWAWDWPSSLSLPPPSAYRLVYGPLWVLPAHPASAPALYWDPGADAGTGADTGTNRPDIPSSAPVFVSTAAPLVAQDVRLHCPDTADGHDTKGWAVMTLASVTDPAAPARPYHPPAWILPFACPPPFRRFRSIMVLVACLGLPFVGFLALYFLRETAKAKKQAARERDLVSLMTRSRAFFERHPDDRHSVKTD